MCYKSSSLPLDSKEHKQDENIRRNKFMWSNCRNPKQSPNHLPNLFYTIFILVLTIYTGTGSKNKKA